MDVHFESVRIHAIAKTVELLHEPLTAHRAGSRLYQDGEQLVFFRCQVECLLIEVELARDRIETQVAGGQPRLRAAGLPCPIVSVGSTPTALSAEDLSGVTEVRAGVYVFFDLFMAGVGVCTLDDIALSVLTTVIGHQPDKGWAIVDAGWMAMSRDRGTQSQRIDQGYGVVCSADGVPIDDYVMTGANQEHGIVARRGGGADAAIDKRFPIGTLLRVLPNHACATGAQFLATVIDFLEHPLRLVL